MYKLIIIPLMIVVWLIVYGNQLHQELSLKAYYIGKQAVNHAAHAGALQIDKEKLGEGIFAIEPNEARRVALQYLFSNLSLNRNGNPLSQYSLLKEIEIVHFEVLDERLSYPYQYELQQYQYRNVIYRPAVIIVVNMKVRHMFSGHNPVEWNIIGSAQIVI